MNLKWGSFCENESGGMGLNWGTDRSHPAHRDEIARIRDCELASEERGRRKEKSRIE